MKQKFVLLIVFILIAQITFATTKKVLFIGNSYTAYNNLPEMVKQLGLSNGDTLVYEAINPGGTSLEQHYNNAATISTINSQIWDFVVLQEQSQRPAFSDVQVQTEVFPYAQKLDSIIKLNNGCTKTIFYMTWGRKNGDASNCAVWPPVCTYLGMDSLLQLRYTQMAEQNNGVISPVAKVWRYLRNNHPNLELYDADESHPTIIGSYAAATSFYALIFGKSPLNNSFIATLSAADAQIVQSVADNIVYDSLQHWRRYAPYPRVDSILVDSTGGALNAFGFTGVNPHNVIGYEWSFGDGSGISYAVNPVYIYSNADSYQVCLTVIGICNETATYCIWIKTDSITVDINEHHKLVDIGYIFPNPTSGQIQIKGIKGTCNYVVHDLNGRQLQFGTISERDFNIILPVTLPSGIYFISLSKGEQGYCRTFKFIKE